MIESFEIGDEPSVPMKGGNFLTKIVTVMCLLYVQSQFRISSQVFKMYKIQKVYYINQHRFSSNINAFMILTSLLWASPQWVVPLA